MIKVPPNTQPGGVKVIFVDLMIYPVSKKVESSDAYPEEQSGALRSFLCSAKICALLTVFCLLSLLCSCLLQE